MDPSCGKSQHNAGSLKAGIFETHTISCYGDGKQAVERAHLQQIQARELWENQTENAEEAGRCTDWIQEMTSDMSSVSSSSPDIDLSWEDSKEEADIICIEQVPHIYIDTAEMSYGSTGTEDLNIEISRLARGDMKISRREEIKQSSKHTDLRADNHYGCIQSCAGIELDKMDSIYSPRLSENLKHDVITSVRNYDISSENLSETERFDSNFGVKSDLSVENRVEANRKRGLSCSTEERSGAYTSIVRQDSSQTTDKDRQNSFFIASKLYDDFQNDDDLELLENETSVSEKNIFKIVNISGSEINEDRQSYSREDVHCGGVNTREGDRSYVCDICGESFVKNKNLKAHKRKHTEKPFKCDICGVEFAYSRSLQIHKIFHSGDGAKLGACTVEFPHRRNEKACEVTNAGERSFKCDLCGAGFTQNGGLKAHMRIHTGVKPYKCDVCGADFSQSSSLTAHIRVHTGEKPFNCDVCGVWFSHKGNLTAHQKIHANRKSCKCDVCGAEFFNNGHLTTHKKSHTGEKPYTRDICGTGYSQQGNLKMQVHNEVHKQVHSEDKSHRCDICGVEFAQSSSLNIHKMFHTVKIPYTYNDSSSVGLTLAGSLKPQQSPNYEQTPYRCNVCDCEFSQISSLKTHMIVHTRQRLYDCDECGVEFSLPGNLKSHKSHTSEKNRTSVIFVEWGFLRAGTGTDIKEYIQGRSRIRVMFAVSISIRVAV